MRVYAAFIRNNVLLTFRDRTALFFSYAFPLIFFFIFGQSTNAEQGGVITQVVSMVLLIGVLGNGFFGAGLRAVMDREQNILRRFKVAPISAAPLLVSSLVTGWLFYMPAAVMVLALAHFMYGMPVPERLTSLFVFVSLGVIAFRSMGLIVASIVNSMQESQIVIQLLYLPMLFLSGATFPISMLPGWLQIISQFLPASYLHLGLQSILLKRESAAENLAGIVAMLITTVLSTLLGVKLFRWEKEEKIPAAGKLWLLAVLFPFLVLGAWDAYSSHNVRKAKVLARDLRRTRTMLISNARIFAGDGRMIPQGAILIKNGRIARLIEGTSPEAKDLKADSIDASGKTVLPGLIDVHVHLGAPGGVPASDMQATNPAKDEKEWTPDNAYRRALAAYLFSGVTAVRSVGDSVDGGRRAADDIASGERLGAELFACGPLFTTEGGHGTEYAQSMPEPQRAALKVQGLKVVIEAGAAGMLFSRIDTGILRAISAEAQARKLPVAAHTGDARDVRDAIEAGATSIEHGSARERIPDALFAEMVRRGITYTPTLSVVEAFREIASGSVALLDRSLVQQVGPTAVLTRTRELLFSGELAPLRSRVAAFPMSMDVAMDNLRRAHQAGVRIAAGTDSGSILLAHGPAIHRELALLVKAGLPPTAALIAATSNGARLLGADGRLGLIEPGREATLLVVDGNPLEDITATERISLVLFRGERVGRSDLFDQK
jgi:imidazolonepropionase-like amidohydrolase/ABC-type multidrug transport system permease subunit